MDDGTKSLSELDSHIGLRQQALSEVVASKVLKLFRISVIATLVLTLLLASINALFIAKGWMKPADRIVTEKVVLAIIGASIVQVGAAAIAIVYSLFRKSAGSVE